MFHNSLKRWLQCAHPFQGQQTSQRELRCDYGDTQYDNKYEEIFTGYNGQFDHVKTFQDLLRKLDVDKYEPVVEATIVIDKKINAISLALKVVPGDMQSIQIAFKNARMQSSMDKDKLKCMVDAVREALDRCNKTIYANADMIHNLHDVLKKEGAISERGSPEGARKLLGQSRKWGPGHEHWDIPW